MPLGLGPDAGLPHSNSSSCVLCVPLEDEACVGVSHISFPFSTYFFPISNHLSVNTSALGNSTFSLFLILIKTYQNVVSPSLSLRLCHITKPSDPLMKDFLLLNILIRDNA